MSRDALSGRQFFHATPQDFKPGDTLLPHGGIGQSNFDGGGADSSHVFMSDHPDVAHDWADLIAFGNSRSDHPKSHINVYEVRPHGPVKSQNIAGVADDSHDAWRDEHTGELIKEHLAPRATVVRLHSRVRNTWLPQ